MTNPTKTEAIKAFLKAKTFPDLAGLYTAEHECQVNVAQDGGERVDGDFHGRQWHGWTDGVQVWKSFRIPFKANSDPEYTDSPITFDLGVHAEGIGMTGWNWKKRQSEWFGYDFDAITGHSDKHARKLTDEEMNRVREAAMKIDWVSVRRSASGKGLHLYVRITPAPTNNHNEHAALARAILAQMSALVGFDFKSKVDICGGNMWVWHRKMIGTNGLELLKQGEILTDVPPNWRDHVKVVSGKRRKNLPGFIEEVSKTKTDAESIFDELTGQRSRVPLDDEHKKLLNFLTEQRAQWWWDSDHHMAVAHTYDLKTAHEMLNLRGIFDTNAKGTEKGADHNCFSGDVEVLTESGVRTFRELAERGRAKLYVLTDVGMRWLDCEIRSFGKQPTVSLRFGDHSIIRTTLDHNWLELKNRQVKLGHYKKTYQITPGKTTLPLAHIEIGNPDPEGYAHGFVFGDGWVKHHRSGREQTTEVALFKRDVDLQSLLLKFGDFGVQKYNGKYQNVVRNLPGHWKELPSRECSKDYALGFILGLMSADGFMHDGYFEISQNNMEHIFDVRELAIYSGLRCNPVRQYAYSGYKESRAYKFDVSTYNLTEGHFLRKDHKLKFRKAERNIGITVSNIYNDTKVEEVYCAVVPHYHNFTLANGVITGNCFLYPLRRGAWSVRRFSPGCAEADTWTQDAAGWTQCYYNKEPDLATAARSQEGIENAKGAFVFQHAEQAVKAAQMMGTNIVIPNSMASRSMSLRVHKDGRLIAEVERGDRDLADQMKGWLPEKGKWQRIFNVTSSGPVEQEVGNYDDMVRHLVTESGEDCGWVLKCGDSWSKEPVSNIKDAIKSLGFKLQDTINIIGGSIFKPWKLVNRPFQPEYPGDREWNRNAAQFRFTPTENRDNLKYDHWLKILKHCGQGLDDAIKNHGWCKANGIQTGADYLKVWIASLFQHPEEPLPYLFFYGPQGSGKSIFHEALARLITAGYQRADTALTNPGTFNGELENAILCVVEETDLRKSKQAYNKIKDWVTSPEIQIHAKNRTPYSIPNKTHFVHCANEHTACPIFTGDTRITVIFVPNLEPIDQIPKKFLFQKLDAEAADFLAEVLSLEIPPSNDRLHVPVITTDEKISAAEANQTMLQVFINEKTHKVPGKMISVKEFADRFHEWLEPSEVGEWSKIRVGRELPPEHPKGRSPSNGQFYICNISWEPKKPEEPELPKLIVKDGKICST